MGCERTRLTAAARAALGWLISALAALAACWACARVKGRRSGVQAGAAGGEVVAFGGVAGQQQGLVVGEAGLAGAVEPAQVFRAGGGQVVVAGQLRLGGEGVRRWSSGRC